jgi:hypothetical protein
MSALGQKQTFRTAIAVSALPRKRTFRQSFDHLVSALLKMKRYAKSQRFGGLEIDNQLKLGRLFDR